MLPRTGNVFRILCSSNTKTIFCSKRHYRSTGNYVNLLRPKTPSINRKCFLADCWKCGSKNQETDLFCIQCNSLQKPDISKTHFDIIGITPKYTIEIKELTTKYRKLQNSLHPDRFSSKPEEERNISEEYSSLVNKAYSTLLHPMGRGLYMLELRGIHLEEDTMQTDPAFLAQIMENNEQLAEAESAEDIRKLDTDNKRTLDDLARELAAAFSAEDIEAAKQVLIKMKYYSSIDNRIKDLKQKLGIE